MTYVPVLPASGFAGWSYLNRTLDTQQANFERSGLVARETAGFAEKIKGIETVDDLMKDRQVLKVALGAFGLGEDLDNRAFIRRVLESDLTDTTSLANRLSDKRYLDLARTFNFAGEAGPSLAHVATAEAAQSQLADVATPDDLLSNGSLLRATLRQFDLEDMEGNTYFLQQVLESDLSDETSFVNRLGDPRLVELAQAFDFQKKAELSKSAVGFAALFEDRIDSLTSADDLLEDRALLQSALGLFGLEDRIDDTAFLRDVLESDLYDDTSFANTLEDKRWAAFSDAFAFGDPYEEPGTAAKFIEVLSEREAGFDTSSDVMANVPVRLATLDLFGLTNETPDNNRLRLVLEQDPADSNSLVNLLDDKRYLAMSRAFGLGEPDAPPSYPPGFAEAITQSYIDHQFEIAVGESDSNMRLALALERELDKLVGRGGSDNAMWFRVMGSEPLRAVFQTAMGLPDSLAQIDVDQQLSIFQARAERQFGVDSLKDFLEPDKMNELRRRFLAMSSLSNDTGFASSTSIAATLLASAQQQRR